MSVITDPFEGILMPLLPHVLVHKGSEASLYCLLPMLMLLSARRTPWTSNRLSCFFYFKWQCLYNTRNLKLSPGPYHLALGHQLTPCTATPCPPENTSEDAWGCPVWAEVRKGLAQRHREGLRRPGSLLSLRGTNEIHIRCMVIKKLVTPCLDGWFYNFKWPTAIDPINPQSTPISLHQKCRHSYTN